MALHFQGLNANTGQFPTPEETHTWRAAWVAREAVLVALDGMSKKEQMLYFNKLVAYMVSVKTIILGICLTDISDLQKSEWKKSQKEGVVSHVDVRMPYIMASAFKRHTQAVDEKHGLTKADMMRILVEEEDVGHGIGVPVYSGLFRLDKGLKCLSSPSIGFWLREGNVSQ